MSLAGINEKTRASNITNAYKHSVIVIFITFGMQLFIIINIYIYNFFVSLGNVGKDNCGCCDSCLKQEGEICAQGSLQEKCDHHAPHCLQLNGNPYKQCVSLKKGKC